MKIIEVYSMRRSGHHAVISWMKRNFDAKYGIDKTFYIGDVINNFSYKGEALDNKIEQLISNNCEILIISYEDVTQDTTRLNEKYSSMKMTVIRDIFNLAASRFKANTGIGMRIDDYFVNTWIRLTEADIIFRYEDFIQNKEVRDSFSAMLQVENIDKYQELGYCSNIGSSFIGKNLDTVENYMNRFKMVELPEKQLSYISTEAVASTRKKLRYI